MPKHLNTSSELTFGVWEGCTIKSVMDVDPGYIKWLLNEGIIKIVKKEKKKLTKEDKINQIKKRQYELV